MSKLWQQTDSLNTFLEHFSTDDDLTLDGQLIKYDIWGSLAHASMLGSIGLLTAEEVQQLRGGLLSILQEAEAGSFPLQFGDEDMHSKIETVLTERLGSVGKKIHTGRSRNDQVLTALRLYQKDALLMIAGSASALATAFLNFAEKYEFVPWPGYTHTQKAMPSSLGMWAGAHLEALLENLQLLESTYSLIDQCPLGSAAGYGVPLPLNRELTAELLGFARVQNNALACQNSRGKLDGVILSTLVALLSDINTFATDVLFFTTSECNYFTVADDLCSGSSIMPQKHNVDSAELLRSKVHLVLGNYVQMVSLSTNLISGYHRDLQDTKRPLVASLTLTEQCLQIATLLLKGLQPNIDTLTAALTPEIFTAHLAFQLTAQGLPFRDAYHQAKTQPPVTPENLERLLKEPTHSGSTGNLGLSEQRKILRRHTQHWHEQRTHFTNAISNLTNPK